MNFAKRAHDERLPLYQRLSDEMLEKITSGEWPPDEAIPTEIELLKTYGVALGTVRKAVEILVSQGVLERNQGRGTFVRRPSFDASLFRFFRHLTNDGGRKIPQGKILAKALLAPSASVASALSISRKSKAIRLDRQRLIDGRVILAEEIWLPQTYFSALLDLELSEFDHLLYPFYEARCGQIVASAKETLTIESAKADVAEQLGIEAGKPVVLIERLALAYDGTPLEWRRSYGAADDFRYQVDIC